MEADRGGVGGGGVVGYRNETKWNARRVIDNQNQNLKQDKYNQETLPAREEREKKPKTGESRLQQHKHKTITTIYIIIFTEYCATTGADDDYFC